MLMGDGVSGFVEGFVNGRVLRGLGFFCCYRIREIKFLCDWRGVLCGVYKFKYF